MTKSVYEIWLSTADNKERLRLPVLPSSLGLSIGNKNESIDISNLGEVTVIQDPSPKTVQFSSFFPAKSTPLVEYSSFPKPWEAIQRIEKWQKSKKPLRLVVTKTKINIPVSIDTFNYSEEGGSVGDILYDLSLKEYKFVSVRKIKVKVPKKPKRPNPKPKPRTHTVKSGDTLWDLARKYYGNSLEWRKIWNANKPMMVKRDKRNLKQPGHWIYPQQRLKIP
ncbi:Nucleoid-associated protein YgaU, contains BON and LysM domains [Gracilibacillus orientalis]|uniref:Nucleoid-associated protein YgaU, contains BON and LysM domains n=1 Tax=Gracilibacillus orientalis TaxID=334253 RepID=A0A1I4PNM4_9BACI|nr:LysM peptidoglycan-binding domain-containing protein [Gracilibacillus orientalis]SFM29206.1 Nucleoid-associated protein YgaU, contains BON and LysM domains [Gracilibacillus orientalis]